MPKIPVNKLEEDNWTEDDLVHDHLGRPVKDRRPRRPQDTSREQRQDRYDRRPERNDED
jgi:hypothetical protein